MSAIHFLAIGRAGDDWVITLALLLFGEPAPVLNEVSMHVAHQRDRPAAAQRPTEMVGVSGRCSRRSLALECNCGYTVALMATAWFLCSYRLPREPSRLRLAIWRRAKRLGALLLHDAVWVLPADARTREDFDWLAEEIEERGGSVMVWEAWSVPALQDAMGPAARTAHALDAALRLTRSRRPVMPTAAAGVTIDSGEVFTALGKHGKASGSMAQVGLQPAS